MLELNTRRAKLIHTEWDANILLANLKIGLNCAPRMRIHSTSSFTCSFALWRWAFYCAVDGERARMWTWKTHTGTACTPAHPPRIPIHVYKMKIEWYSFFMCLRRLHFSAWNNQIHFAKGDRSFSIENVGGIAPARRPLNKQIVTGPHQHQFARSVCWLAGPIYELIHIYVHLGCWAYTFEATAIFLLTTVHLMLSAQRTILLFLWKKTS